MKCFIFFLIISSFVGTSHAQTKLIGRITNEQGAPVAGASVFIVGPVIKAKLTDARGYYVFLSIPEGKYVVKASKQGKVWKNSLELAGKNLHRKDIQFGKQVTQMRLAKANTQPPSPAKAPPKNSPQQPAHKTAANKKPAYAKAQPLQEKTKTADASILKPEKKVQLASTELPMQVIVTGELSQVLQRAKVQEENINQMPEKQVSVEGGLTGIYKKIIYPDLAKRLYIQGKVVVKVTVNEAGQISQIDFLKPGHEVLNEEVIRVLTTETHFIPAKLNGHAVAGSLVIPIKFALKR